MHFTFSLFNKLKPGDAEFGAYFRQVFGVAAGLKNMTVWDFFFFSAINPQWTPRETLIIDTNCWHEHYLREKSRCSLVGHRTECPRRTFRRWAGVWLVGWLLFFFFFFCFSFLGKLSLLASKFECFYLKVNNVYVWNTLVYFPIHFLIHLRWEGWHSVGFRALLN